MTKQKKYRGQDIRQMQISQNVVSEFGNKIAIVDGIEFDSIREAGYYQFLKNLKN